MNLTGKLSIAALVTGIVVLVVLTALGGVIKKTLDDTIMSRLEYELPKGYKHDKNYQECYRSTKSDDFSEYYLWNLTNLPDVLAGGKAHFNLTGPFAYAQWYCHYDHHIDEDIGLLTYRVVLEGYRYIPAGSVPEDVLITNVNPGYLGVLAEAGSETNLGLAMTAGVLKEFIGTVQKPSSIQLISLSAVGQALNTANQQIYAGFLSTVVLQNAVGTLEALRTQAGGAVFFSPSFVAPNGFEGWAKWTSTLNSAIDTSVAASTADSILADWAEGTETLTNYTSAQYVEKYAVTEEQGTWLVKYTKEYVLAAATYPAAVPTATALLHQQWAHSTLDPNVTHIPLQWALSTSDTGVTAADVTALFDASSPCALASSTGIQVWLNAISKESFEEFATGSCKDIYTLTPAQYLAIAKWIPVFATHIAGPGVLKTADVTNWDDFAYAQWGKAKTILGQSLGPAAGLTWFPEINMYDNYTAKGFTFPLDASCVEYTAAEAKSLLTGAGALTNSTNMVTLLTMLLTAAANPSSAGEIAMRIGARWPALTFQKAACFGFYAQDVLFEHGSLPTIQGAIDKGAGMFVTRTAREWLFTANDTLLVTLGQEDTIVGVVGNETRSKAEADAMNKTAVRVYTGKNDLHWSLMPSAEGQPLPFWRGGNVSITGYNGTQFPPNGAINDELPAGHPLVLWHRLITRPVPFKPRGKGKWEGVNVVHLSMTDDAILSEARNPANYPYYAELDGTINKTADPAYNGLPLFLTKADMFDADPRMTSTITYEDKILNTTYDSTDRFSRHRLSLFLLVEPDLGSTLWGNLPIQANFKYGPTDHFYRNVRPAYAPIYWNAIGDKATTKDLDTVKDVLYFAKGAWKPLIGVGVGFGTVCIIAGIIGLHHYYKHKNELRDISDSNSSSLSKSSTEMLPTK